MSEGKNITASQVLNLIQSQNFRCAISGRTLTPETASLDHIVPLGRGGAHALGNIWVVDHEVNSAQGTLSIERFRSLCREVAEYQANLAPAGNQGKLAS